MQCDPIRMPGPSTLDANKLKRPTQPLATAEVTTNCATTAAEGLLSVTYSSVNSAQLPSIVTETAWQTLEGKDTDALL